MRRIVMVAVAGLLLACASPVLNAEEVVLETEDQKILYAVGQALSQSVAGLEFTAEEMKFITAGLSDGATGAEAKIDMQVYGPQIQATLKTRALAMAQKEKEEGVAYVTKKGGEEGAETLESGMVYRTISEGAGASPAARDTVKVIYHGTLRDGTVFDSNRGGEPAQFNVGGVIPCFSEALQRMKVGGKAEITCPSDLAYGERGSPPKIRPGAALTFEMELVDVISADAPAEGGGSDVP